MRLAGRRWPTAPSGRVFVHIGAPATGSRQLAATLRRHRRALTHHGLLYPTCHVGAQEGQLAAVLDVLGLADGGHVTTGAWARLVQTARDWRRGTVLVSHELLADAGLEQVERMLADLRGLEVHAVYVARDLGRQLPAAWQEWVRSGGTVEFEAYVDAVAARAPGRPARMFWRSHDVAAVLDRWATFLPPERLHVVTAPRGAEPGEELWRRFGRTVDLDTARLPVVGRADAPLALAAAEALRRLNGATGAPPSAELLAAAAAVPGPAPAVPSRLAGWLREEGEQTVLALEKAGYDVVGDVEELRPAAITTCGGSDVPAAEEVLAAQTAMLAHLSR